MSHESLNSLYSNGSDISDIGQNPLISDIGQNPLISDISIKVSLELLKQEKLALKLAIHSLQMLKNSPRSVIEEIMMDAANSTKNVTMALQSNEAGGLALREAVRSLRTVKIEMKMS